MEQVPLDVEVVGQSESRCLIATGELDLAGVPALDAALLNAERAHVREVVLDLRGVTFIDSSGIRCVLDAYHRCRRRGADLRILPGLEAGVVFRLAGLAGRLPFVV
ncbi:MAG: STAS domain-containing protein [Solirubrobacteraceae bacterium]